MIKKLIRKSSKSPSYPASLLCYGSLELLFYIIRIFESDMYGFRETMVQQIFFDITFSWGQYVLWATIATVTRNGTALTLFCIICICSEGCWIYVSLTKIQTLNIYNMYSEIFMHISCIIVNTNVFQIHFASASITSLYIRTNNILKLFWSGYSSHLFRTIIGLIDIREHSNYSYKKSCDFCANLLPLRPLCRRKHLSSTLVSWSGHTEVKYEANIEWRRCCRPQLFLRYQFVYCAVAPRHLSNWGCAYDIIAIIYPKSKHCGHYFSSSWTQCMHIGWNKSRLEREQWNKKNKGEGAWNTLKLYLIISRYISYLRWIGNLCVTRATSIQNSNPFSMRGYIYIYSHCVARPISLDIIGIVFLFLLLLFFLIFHDCTQ